MNLWLLFRKGNEIMTKFDDFLEWLEANPWIGLLVGVLVLCGFFRGLHYWKVPFEVSALGSGIVAGLLVGLVSCSKSLLMRLLI